MAAEKHLEKDTLVGETTRVLRSYIEPYHLEYPRLLAQGLNERKIADELNKAPEIVEYHVDRLYDRIPGLKRHEERKEILELALAARNKLGPIKAVPVAPVSKAPAPAEPALRPPAAQAAAKIEPKIQVVTAPPPTTVPVPQEPEPTEKELETRLDELNDGQHVLLDLAEANNDSILADILTRKSRLEVTASMVQLRFQRIFTLLKIPGSKPYDEGRAIAIAAHKRYRLTHPIPVVAALPPALPAAIPFRPAPASAPPAPTPKPSAPVAVRKPSIAAVSKPKETAPKPKKALQFVEMEAPPRERLVRGINQMPPRMREMLGILMEHETEPPFDEVVRRFGGKEPSVAAMIASTFSHAGLAAPRTMSRDDPWFKERFTLLRQVYRSGEILPPRESKKAKRKPGPEASCEIQERSEPRTSFTEEFVDHGPADESKPIISIVHLPNISAHEEKIGDLLRRGYRVEKSYMSGSLERPVTVLVLVKRGDVSSR